MLTVDSRPGSTTRKSSLQGVRRMVVDGASVKINPDGILNPNRSHQPPAKPKKALSDRPRKGDPDDLSLSNRFNILSDDEMDTSSDKTK